MLLSREKKNLLCARIKALRIYLPAYSNAVMQLHSGLFVYNMSEAIFIKYVDHLMLQKPNYL